MIISAIVGDKRIDHITHFNVLYEQDWYLNPFANERTATFSCISIEIGSLDQWDRNLIEGSDPVDIILVHKEGPVTRYDNMLCVSMDYASNESFHAGFKQVERPDG